MSSRIVWCFTFLIFGSSPLAFALTGHVYNFSFAKKAAPKSVAAKSKVLPKKVTTVAAPESASVVSEVVPPAAVITPSAAVITAPAETSVPAHAYLTQSVRVKADEPSEKVRKSWTLSLSGAQLADRNSRRVVPALGLETQLVGDLFGEAQIWNQSGVDGSAGVAYRKQLPNNLRSISLGALAGLLTTPTESEDRDSAGHTLRFFYGVEGFYLLSPRLSILGQIRLQDDSRFGLANVGIGYRL